MMVFELSKAFPMEERFSLTDQVRRSSRSVAANISEAWAKRQYKAAFVSKLNDALGEAAETQTWLEITHRCQYLSAEKIDPLAAIYERIIGQLITISRQPDSWTIPRQ
ncbi:MAG: four helix bundle protein [Armatimonadota bacterium]